MNINIHIDRLILDGMSIPQAQRPLLQAAVEAELARLLAHGALADEVLAGGALPQVAAGTIPSSPNMTATQLGQHIAQAVYQGIGS